jgi:hypothetical protein
MNHCHIYEFHIKYDFYVCNYIHSNNINFEITFRGMLEPLQTSSAKLAPTFQNRLEKCPGRMPSLDRHHKECTTWGGGPSLLPVLAVVAI